MKQKFGFVSFRLLNRALRFEQNHRFEVYLMFGCHFSLVLVENHRQNGAVFFSNVRTNDIDVFGVAVIPELPQVVLI